MAQLQKGDSTNYQEASTKNKKPIKVMAFDLLIENWPYIFTLRGVYQCHFVCLELVGYRSQVCHGTWETTKTDNVGRCPQKFPSGNELASKPSQEKVAGELRDLCIWEVVEGWRACNSVILWNLHGVSIFLRLANRLMVAIAIGVNTKQFKETACSLEFSNMTWWRKLVALFWWTHLMWKYAWQQHVCTRPTC